MKVVLRRGAERDIAEAMEWYEKQDYELGQRFLAAVRTLIARIAAAPRHFPRMPTSIGGAQPEPAGRTIRRGLVRSYPYAVYFVLETSRVVILAVIHQRRAPDAVRALLAR
ncbi:MAG: type II toxin-antitoxin system RelE/ParE family toxin [Rhodospirillales bacterium]|nr:type II toxin-antitoxin system RelE/ParE family toxin [Rhodospirillales bacterium]